MTLSNVWNSSFCTNWSSSALPEQSIVPSQDKCPYGTAQDDTINSHRPCPFAQSKRDGKLSSCTVLNLDVLRFVDVGGIWTPLAGLDGFLDFSLYQDFVYRVQIAAVTDLMRQISTEAPYNWRFEPNEMVILNIWVAEIAWPFVVRWQWQDLKYKLISGVLQGEAIYSHSFSDGEPRPWRNAGKFSSFSGNSDDCP